MNGHKLIKESDKHFEIMHPDGSSFKVAKSGLSKAHMDKIRGMPKVKKMADGGEVDNGDQSSSPVDEIPDQMTQQSGPYAGLIQSEVTKDPSILNQPTSVGPTIPWDQAAQQSGPYAGLIQAEATKQSKPSKESLVPQINPNTQMPQGGMQKASYGDDEGSPATSAYQDISQQNQKIIGDQINAIQQSAAAASAATAQQQKIYAESAQKMQDLQSETQKKYAALDRENEALTKAITNQKIDPTRVWSSADTGNKVLAGIGLILGGMGAGLTGGKNEALDTMNRIIDRDIDAQKADLGKKQNLLTMNYHKYGNLQAATTATSIQLNAVTQAQIASAASKSQNAQVQQNAALAIGTLKQQQNAQQMQLATMEAMSRPGDMQLTSYGNAPEGDIPRLDQGKLRLGVMSGAIPQKQQAEAMKEYGEYQKMTHALETLDKNFKDIQEQQTTGNRVFSPLQSRSRINSTKKLASTILAKDLSGRATETDIASMMESFPEFPDNDETIALKRDNLRREIIGKFSFPTLQNYGVIQAPSAENSNKSKDIELVTYKRK